MSADLDPAAVEAATVPCTCGAKPGEPCYVDADGPWFHAERVNVARDQREVEELKAELRGDPDLDPAAVEAAWDTLDRTLRAIRSHAQDNWRQGYVDLADKGLSALALTRVAQPSPNYGEITSHHPEGPDQVVPADQPSPDVGKGPPYGPGPGYTIKMLRGRYVVWNCPPFENEGDTVELVPASELAEARASLERAERRAEEAERALDIHVRAEATRRTELAKASADLEQCYTERRELDGKIRQVEIQRDEARAQLKRVNRIMRQLGIRAPDQDDDG